MANPSSCDVERCFDAPATALQRLDAVLFRRARASVLERTVHLCLRQGTGKKLPRSPSTPGCEGRTAVCPRNRPPWIAKDAVWCSPRRRLQSGRLASPRMPSSCRRSSADLQSVPPRQEYDCLSGQRPGPGHRQSNCGHARRPGRSPKRGREPGQSILHPSANGSEK
jgi:hypothetical protein